ncbi:hypothetical protein TRIUR3_26311 [Triticum urartu]|uniref:Uncharacterized protein n=1 Tax=Triticum urartu TaxID=4572 RepID=M7ZIA4_TRIUA|nr:hypothetical protein TRIUR3_26311 [Triticum urartu]
MEIGKKRILGVVATLVVLQLLVAAPVSMARSPQVLKEMAQSGKIAIESLILEAPVGYELCGETCALSGGCNTGGCQCAWPVCIKNLVVPA